MKKSEPVLFFLFICFLCFVVDGCSYSDSGRPQPSQGRYVDVKVPVTLAAALRDDGINPATLIRLSVSGYIDDTDLRYLRLLAGRDEDNDSGFMLSDLDLSDATITVGGEPYYRAMHSTDDELARDLFRDCHLRSIVLPRSLRIISSNALSCHIDTPVVIPGSVETLDGDIFGFSPDIPAIVCESEYPVSDLYDNPFRGLDLAHTLLVVPAGCAEMYGNALYWQDFRYIEEADL